GRPALPRTLGPDEAAAALEWSETGPTLDLPGRPEADQLRIVGEPEGERGWLLTLRADEDGTFSLPPLPPGTYRVAVGAGEPLALAALDPGEGPDGTLRLVDGRQGVLRVDEPLTEGRIPVEGP